MRRILLAAGVAGALVALALLLPGPAGELAAWIKARREAVLDWGLAGGAGIALLYALATVLLLPAAVLTLAIGYVYGPWAGTAIVSPGSVLGATLAFLLGRGLLRGWVERKMGAHPRFQALDRAIAGDGLRILVLTRLSPVFPFVYLNYAFGLTRVPLRHYLIGSFVAMLPGTFLYVYLGSLGAAAGAGRPASLAFQLVGLLATLLVTVWVARLARRAFRAAAPELSGDA